MSSDDSESDCGDNYEDDSFANDDEGRSVEAGKDSYDDEDENDTPAQPRAISLQDELEEERALNDRLRRELEEAGRELAAQKSVETKGEDPGNETLESLRYKVWEGTARLVREGEKMCSLAQLADRLQDELKELRLNIDGFRRLLLEGIAGGGHDKDGYANVSLEELLRIRLQEEGSRSKNPVQLSEGPTSDELSDPMDAATSERIDSLERDLKAERRRNESLVLRCSHLSDELSASHESVHKVEELRSKITQMVERSRHEKAMRARTEREIAVANEKVDVLSDHIERLMIHLKHEAIAKAKASSVASRAQREVELLTSRNQVLSKLNARKDRAVQELKEGGKILEDQLRLMDEKYMELRVKLDWTRTQTMRTIKKKDEEIKAAKFAVLKDYYAPKSSSGPNVKGGSNVPDGNAKGSPLGSKRGKQQRQPGSKRQGFVQNKVK